MVSVFAVLAPLLHLITTCGAAVDPALTQAIIQVESRGVPSAIRNNTTRQAVFPATVTEATALATGWWQQRHSLDLGLMQINSAWLSRYAVSIDQLFDPCTNIRIGTAIYQANVKHCQRLYPGLDPTTCALSFYHRGHPTAATAYADAVIRRLPTERARNTGLPDRLVVRAAMAFGFLPAMRDARSANLFVPLESVPPELQSPPERARCLLFGCPDTTMRGVFVERLRPAIFPGTLEH